MSETKSRLSGGCLCGAVRWRARAEPAYAGYCFCGDCRKASGSGFIPFMGFAAKDLAFEGETRVARTRLAGGREAARNFCPACGGLVFGGVVGETDSHTIYAGSLDDPSGFRPEIAIFDAQRPGWVPLPPGLRVFPGLPD